MHTLLKPKIFDTFEEGYTGSKFRHDLIAGILIGILSIPLSIAFAIAGGAEPEQGLLTAIIAGFLGGLTSGSRYQISGPTGAFVILVSNIIQQHGFSGLYIATFIAGILLILMGISRLGFVIKFIPYPVIIGFTSGLAVLIFTGQMPDMFGFQIANYSSLSFIHKWKEVILTLPKIHPPSFFIAALTLIVAGLAPKIFKSIPGSLLAIAISMLAVTVFKLDVETLQDRFGKMEVSLSPIPYHIPDFDGLMKLISPAIAIALLAGIESLLSAVVADGMTGRRHRSNMELISQGICNLASSLFGGLPVTGAIARTATNIKSGGLTPVTSLVGAATILLAVFFFQNLLLMIPLATLSGILILIAYKMSEWRHFVKLFYSPVGDIVILLTTFALTIFVDLISGIEVGIILAAFIFINRIAENSKFRIFRDVDDEEDKNAIQEFTGLEIPPEIQVFEIQGALFFAAVEKFKMALQRIEQPPKVLILQMNNLLDIDASGIRALYDLLEQSKLQNTKVLFSGMPRKGLLYKTLLSSKIIDHLSGLPVQPDIASAIRYAKDII